MSRRENRDYDSRHHRSRYDREPSPKRGRRDGKTAAERPTSNLNLNSAEHINRDEKHHRRLQDSMPLEAPVAPDSKIETVSLIKESNKKSNGYREGTKNSSDNIEPSRSRSHFQHDERAGQVGRSFRHRELTDSKDHQSDRATNRSTNNEDRKPRDMILDSKQPSKKRPSFRETKLPVDAGNGEKSAPSRNEHSRKEERGKAPEKPPVVRHDRRSSGERDPHRMKFQSRERYGGSYRERDRFNGRQGRVDKWKHDLYDEANKSPTSKNEEDQIAKLKPYSLHSPAFCVSSMFLSSSFVLHSR